MTDTKLWNHRAGLVMGWHLHGYKDAGESLNFWVDENHKRVDLDNRWDPFRNIEQAFMLADNLEEYSYVWEMYGCVGGYEFLVVHSDTDDAFSFGKSENKAEAITRACVEALEKLKQKKETL